MKKYGIWIALIAIIVIVVAIVQIIKKPKDDYFVRIGEAPKFEFTDQNGQTITQEKFKGMVYVVEFFFTSCPTICPIMNRNMVKIQNEFEHEDLGIASITIDPETDTPTRMKQYADIYGVTNPNWHMMTGEAEDIYNLANNKYNIYAKAIDPAMNGFEHSGNFALIDKEGYIVSRKNESGSPKVYYNGTKDEEVQMLIEDIRRLIKK